MPSPTVKNEFPSRLDLGKHKYGGPFTTKQVEDVKAFLGILKVLVCIGPAFMLQVVAVSVLPVFAKHGNVYVNETAQYDIHPEGTARHIFLSNSLLSPLLIIMSIPLYLSLIRPHILYYIPGIFKRIGLGIILMILSLLCTFAMDVIVHSTDHAAHCMFKTLFPASNVTVDSSLPLYKNIYFLISQHLLSALFNMLIDIAVLEFICSQSPYSMKGLLFGSFFSIRSLFQAIAMALIIPFEIFWKVDSLSCGSGFYLVIIVIGVLELTLFSFKAKRYKYRTINEPSNEYRYAEDYYSNIQ